MHTRHPPGLRGALIAVTLLLIALVVGALFGLFLFWGVQRLYPAAPNYVVLITTGLALLPVLALAMRRFTFLVNWYYMLPAILVLTVFTLYPIFFTVYLAFTDYSGRRANRPDRTTETQVLALEENRLTLEADPVQALRCEESCEGLLLELYSREGNARLRVEGVDGNDVLLSGVPVFEPEFVARVNEFGFIGLRNFQVIIANASRALIPVFGWNVSFAFASVALSVLVGVLLAVLLSNKQLKFRNVYRTLLIISWALPAVITIQMWVALYNFQFGAINRLLGVLGIGTVPWLMDPLWAKASIVFVNLWLGFPFMMIAGLGVLATIPDELYEAGKVDGAGPLQALTNITLPMLYKPFLPIVLTSFAFNFNNFNIIFLLTGGGPAQQGRLATAQSTDILLSWAYKTAFSAEGQSAYALGAAISLIIFFITVAVSLVNFKLTGVFREAR